MLTILLLIVPLFAALLTILLGYRSIIAQSAALVNLVLSIMALAQVDTILFDQAWLSDWGIRFHLELDGLSKLMILLTNGLMPFIIWSARNKNYNNYFFALVLIMQMALNGVFMARDGLLFYIFWELALIPIYFICLYWGGERRSAITFKFFLYTLAGSLFMLLGLLYVYLKTETIIGGSLSFDIKALYAAGQALSTAEQTWVFWTIFVAFAIKIPLFPFHTWQPDTYTTAPTPGVMLLSGIMLKMGTYGLILWLMPLVPKGWEYARDLVMVLCIVGIIYSSCIAIVQTDFKRLIAYSSIAHVGLIAAGIFSTTTEGLQGAVFQMLSHGIIAVGLFYIADLLENRNQTREIAAMGGIRNVAPKFALCFLLVLLGSVSLPLTNGFVGEFLLLSGIFQYNAWMAAAAGLTVILSAVYMLRSYQGIMLGETNALTSRFVELNRREGLFLGLVIVLIFVLGIFPNLILVHSEEVILSLLNTYNLAIQ
jgi:NADH-quinone oxidoreductase subunit M